jgi:hypothetical protein
MPQAAPYRLSAGAEQNFRMLLEQVLRRSTSNIRFKHTPHILVTVERKMSIYPEFLSPNMLAVVALLMSLVMVGALIMPALFEI